MTFANSLDPVRTDKMPFCSAFSGPKLLAKIFNEQQKLSQLHVKSYSCLNAHSCLKPLSNELKSMFKS